MDEPDLMGGHHEERRPGGLRRGTLAILGAALSALALGTALFYSDRNSDRYELRCGRGRAEPRRGLFFLWGTGTIDDDTHARLVLPDGITCADARFTNLVDLDAAFGALLLETAEHLLTLGGPEALAQAGEDLERATRLQGLTSEQQRRAEALRADMVYHEAREILRQVERDLWQARRKLERARGLGAGQRIRDLEEWLEFVESETERFRPALAGGGPEDPHPVDRQPDAGPLGSEVRAAPSDTFL
jgi:hypothetical protein